jgi:hypothetical protein
LGSVRQDQDKTAAAFDARERMGPDEAKPYRRDLWLRDLRCGAIVDGHEVRLDPD